MLLGPRRTGLALPWTKYRVDDCLRMLLPCFRKRMSVPDAEVDAVEILEEVALVLGHVELGDELLEVGVVRRDVDPRLRHRVEHAVGVVEATVLQAQHALGDLRRGIGRSVVQGDPSAFVDIKTNVLSQYWVGRPLVPKVS